MYPQSSLILHAQSILLFNHTNNNQHSCFLFHRTNKLKDNVLAVKTCGAGDPARVITLQADVSLAARPPRAPHPPAFTRNDAWRTETKPTLSFPFLMERSQKIITELSCYNQMLLRQFL